MFTQVVILITDGKFYFEWIRKSLFITIYILNFITHYFTENREKKQLSFYTILTILPMCDHWIITNVPIFLDILLRESLICLTSLDQLFWFDVLCFWLVLWLIWRVVFFKLSKCIWNRIGLYHCMLLLELRVFNAIWIHF